MRQFLLISLMALLSWQAGAQDETLFRKARIVGAFGGPIVEFSSINGDFVTSSGGGGALIINEFFIGGYGIGSNDYSELVNEGVYRADIGHGGFWIGFTNQKHKLIHIYGSTKIGWGAVDVRFDDNNFNFGDEVFVLTPELGLELNVARWFRIAATGGYRWVDGIGPNQSITDADYRSFAGTLTFRFGWFGRDRHYDYDDD